MGEDVLDSASGRRVHVMLVGEADQLTEAVLWEEEERVPCELETVDMVYHIAHSQSVV